MLNFFKRKLSQSDAWSIVTTAREPLALLQAFTAHHLDAGVEKIYLFFDDPLDTAFHYFSGIDRVEAVRCDAKYWQKQTNERPPSHRKRQRVNAQIAYLKCRSDWIAHIDADEFLVADGDIGQTIAQFGQETPTLRILPVERTFHDTYDDNALVFDGYFKAGSNRKPIGPALFGEIGEHFNRGFQGHDIGKSFVRTGAKNRSMHLHYAWEDGARLKSATVKKKQLMLAHFFPQNFEDWQHKYSRRINNRHVAKIKTKSMKKRLGLYQQALKTNGQQGLRDLFNKLTVLDDRQLALLQSRKLLVKQQFDLDRKKAKHLPNSISATMPAFPAICTNRTSPRAERAARFFQIGMPLCGTKDLCQQFALRGFNTAHCDNGRIARDIQAHASTGSPLLENYPEIDLFACLMGENPDGTPIHAQSLFKELDTAVPQAVFLLNRVSFKPWLASLSAYDNGVLLTRTKKLHDLKTDDQVKEYWVSAWLGHRNAVVDYFSDRPEKLIEFSIDKVKPGHVFDELEARGQLWTPK